MTKFSLYNDTIQGDFDPVEHKYTINGRHIYNITSILDLCPHDHLVFWRMAVYKKFLTNELRTKYGDEIGDAMHNFLWAKKKSKLDSAREVLHEQKIELNGVQFAQLMQQMFSAPTKESQEALDIGHDVHNYCERYGLWKLGKGRKPRKLSSPERRSSIDAFHSWLDTYDVEFVQTEIIVYSVLHDYIGTADLICKIDGELFCIDYKTSKGLYIPYMAQAKGLSDAYFEEYNVYPTPALLRLPKYGEDYEFKVPDLPGSIDANLLHGCHDATKSYYEIERLTK